MKIGISCFKDNEIVSIIETEKVGICDITGKEEAVYDTEDDGLDSSIQNYLVEILNVYSPLSELPKEFPINELDYIEEILFNKWSIFRTNPSNIKKILLELCKDEYEASSLIFTEKVGMVRICDFDYLERNSLVKGSSWEMFVSSIKSINRFHSKHVNLELLRKLFENPRLQMTIKKSNKNLFRARICDGIKFSKDEMGPPPTNLATAGRANSKGIRCLYLSNDITTTLHEIRARDLDFVSIAEFEARKNLRLVDLSILDSISPFSDKTNDYEWYAINMLLLKKISKEISKPLRRHDSTLDYLPAQYIVDFIKSLGFDGVCYKSTLNETGLNYAFFNHKYFKCVTVNLYYIKSLKYESLIVDNKETYKQGPISSREANC